MFCPGHRKRPHENQYIGGVNKKYLLTTYALSLKGSRGISEIPPRHPRFTNYLDMRNTADVTDGKPIAVLLQPISGVSAINS
jgi:hypothetical protein